MATALSSFESNKDQREDFREDINDRCSNEEVQLSHDCEEATDSNSYTRLERFCYPEKIIFQPFQTRKRGFLLIDRWQSRHENILNDCLAIAQLAAQGIIAEGQPIGKEKEAQEMAHQLRTCGPTEREIFTCAARLYSADKFLFKLINSVLRCLDVSNTKVDTLGPFCWLLVNYLSKEKPKESFTVYRGGTLTDKMIEEYKNAVNRRIYWASFISTTRNEKVAEMFKKNTLFIIRITTKYEVTLGDISSVSLFPEEEEVLLALGSHFEVERIEKKRNNCKIFMKIVT